MEESGRVRCNSLDTGLECEKELMSRDDFKNLYQEEPSAAELAQCEAEVGMLLSIIAEVNKKMGSLKAPSDSGDFRPALPSSPLFPDLLSHRLVRGAPEKKTDFSSKHSAAYRGGGGVVWNKLQDAISAVEDSIQCRRSWAAPLSSSDQDTHREHLRAAQESWTKASQILEDLEKDFGISCPKLQQESLDQETRSRSCSQSQQREPESVLLEDEKNKLAGHHRAWRSGSISPSYRRPAMPLSPDWTSQSVPSSPLILRRSARSAAPSSVSLDVSPLGSFSSASPCQANQEGELERLTRYMEKLRCRNERMAAALERKRVESDLLLKTVKRLEYDCSSLQAALRYCGECEEVYDQLLTLHGSKKKHRNPRSAEVDEGEQADGPSAQTRQIGTEEISTSFSTAGGAEETPSEHRNTESVDREVFLLRQIDRLKRERATLCLPKPNLAGAEDSTSSDCGSRSDSFSPELSRPAEGKREKLYCELVSAKEEMSELRAVVRLKEKELRGLEWSLMLQKMGGSSGVFVPENPGEEQQRLYECEAPVCGEDSAAMRSLPILRELQAVLHREQVLKKRLALVHDSDGGRSSGDDHLARLTHAHSKALSSYRHIRRKYREHAWRLEQRVAAMAESQPDQSESSNGEEAEWRREETVL